MTFTTSPTVAEAYHSVQYLDGRGFRLVDTVRFTRWSATNDGADC